MTSATLKRALDLALELPPEERAELARDVLASLDGEPDPDCAQAWDSEITERMAKLESGQSKPVGWDEALRRIDDRLRR